MASRGTTCTGCTNTNIFPLGRLLCWLAGWCLSVCLRISLCSPSLPWICFVDLEHTCYTSADEARVDLVSPKETPFPTSCQTKASIPQERVKPVPPSARGTISLITGRGDKWPPGVLIGYQSTRWLQAPSVSQAHFRVHTSILVLLRSSNPASYPKLVQFMVFPPPAFQFSL